MAVAPEEREMPSFSGRNTRLSQEISNAAHAAVDILDVLLGLIDLIGGFVDFIGRIDGVRRFSDRCRRVAGLRCGVDSVRRIDGVGYIISSFDLGAPALRRGCRIDNRVRGAQCVRGVLSVRCGASRRGGEQRG